MEAFFGKGSSFGEMRNLGQSNITGSVRSQDGDCESIKASKDDPQDAGPTKQASILIPNNFNTDSFLALPKHMQPAQSDLSFQGLNQMTSMSRIFEMNNIMKHLNVDQGGSKAIRSPFDSFLYNPQGSTSLTKGFLQKP